MCNYHWQWIWMWLISGGKIKLKEEIWLQLSESLYQRQIWRLTKFAELHNICRPFHESSLRQATDRSVHPIFTGKVIKQLLVQTAQALQINFLRQKPGSCIWGRQFQQTTEGDHLNIKDFKFTRNWAKFTAFDRFKG